MHAAFSLVTLLWLGPSLAAQTPATPCRPPSVIRQATSEEAVSAVRGRKRTVVTLLGYSDADYENREAMLKTAGSILDKFDPRTAIVTIGATPSGVGAVYQVAKQRGFETAGIVSTLAQQEKVALSPCVDLVFYVNDTQWGGVVEGTDRLSPTSLAMVNASDHVFAIGGGEVSRVEYLAAQRAGKPATFVAADMNHAIARKRAASRGQPPPTDFRGALGAALAQR